MRITIVLASLLLASCFSTPVLSPYKIDIQQGNYVTQDMVSKLKLGMNKSQVRFVLGTPLITDSFHADRWDYPYLYRKHGKLTEQRKIAVFFEDNKLLRIEGDIVPAMTPAATEKESTLEPNADSAATDAAMPAATEKESGEKIKEKSPEVKSQEEKPATAGEQKEEKGFFGKMLEKVGL